MPREAMKMTLREIDLYAQGQNDVTRGRYRQAITVAHLTAKLTRAKKIPPLRQLLPSDPQTSFAPVEERKQSVWSTIRHLARPGELKTAKGKKKTTNG